VNFKFRLRNSKFIYQYIGVIHLNMIDPQKKKLYAWEEYLHDHLEIVEESLSIVECRKIIREMCEDFAIIPPKVIIGKKEYAMASGDGKLIELPKWFLEELSSIHEACHVIAFSIAPQENHHGPTFVRLMIDFIKKRWASEITLKRLEDLALKHNLKIAKLGVVSPVTKREKQRLRRLRTNVKIADDMYRVNQRGSKRAINYKKKRDSYKKELSDLVGLLYKKYWSVL